MGHLENHRWPVALSIQAQFHIGIVQIRGISELRTCCPALTRFGELSSTIFAGSPHRPRYSPPLLSGVGAVAGDVKLQDGESNTLFGSRNSRYVKRSVR